MEMNKNLIGVVLLLLFITGCSPTYSTGPDPDITADTKNKIALCTGSLSQNLRGAIEAKIDKKNPSLNMLIGNDVKELFIQENNANNYPTYVECIKSQNLTNSQNPNVDKTVTGNKRTDKNNATAINNGDDGKECSAYVKVKGYGEFSSRSCRSVNWNNTEKRWDFLECIIPINAHPIPDNGTLCEDILLKCGLNAGRYNFSSCSF